MSTLHFTRIIWRRAMWYLWSNRILCWTWSPLPPLLLEEEILPDEFQSATVSSTKGNVILFKLSIVLPKLVPSMVPVLGSCICKLSIYVFPLRPLFHVKSSLTIHIQDALSFKNPSGKKLAAVSQSIYSLVGSAFQPMLYTPFPDLCWLLKISNQELGSFLLIVLMRWV